MKGKFKRNANNISEFDLIVIDAMNIVHKFYWVMRSLCDSKGRHTGMLYGVLNLVYTLKKKYGSEIIFAWDSRPQVRLDIDPEYKATRDKKKPDGFWTEIKELKLLLSFYGITQYYSEGYEADDIAAKIVKDNSDKNILLISSDGDWFQMLKSDNVKIQISNEIYGKKEIEKKHEIDIDTFTLYKAIVGDKGDNVIGVPRINKEQVMDVCKVCKGILSAARLSVNESIRKKINEYIDTVEKNLKLVSLIDDGYELDEIKKNYDKKRLLNKIKDYEMNALHTRISNE